MQWVWELLLGVLDILIEVTLAMRVVAMYGLGKLVVRSVFLTMFCVLTGLALWAIIGYGLHMNLPSNPGFPGCNAAYTRAQSIRPVTWWEVILFSDTVMFLLTVRRAYQRRSLPLYSGSLLERMANDGSMYFGIISLANLANALTFYLADDLLVGVATWVTTNLSLSLLCRLMLNLDVAAAQGIQTDTLNTYAVDLESIRFELPRVDSEDEN
ncbi:hypothetical protein FB45DRAFT_74824 [Roridomyces roridus]|uniref:Uncharacterized protein n=1 Tax=Roridomyces roridus TaxID=1738132 RepID=A0AAD7BNE1_9AGAR|nr:hypothetical protein FB45DRAFT_74824 [Roridomyces roridus]